MLTILHAICETHPGEPEQVRLQRQTTLPSCCFPPPEASACFWISAGDKKPVGCNYHHSVCRNCRCTCYYDLWYLSCSWEKTTLHFVYYLNMIQFIFTLNDSGLITSSVCILSKLFIFSFPDCWFFKCNLCFVFFVVVVFMNILQFQSSYYTKYLTLN